MYSGVRQLDHLDVLSAILLVLKKMNYYIYNNSEQMAGSVGVGVFMNVDMIPQLFEKLPGKIRKKIKNLYQTIIVPDLNEVEIIDAFADLADKVRGVTQKYKNECPFIFLSVHAEMQPQEGTKFLIFVGVEILEPDEDNVKNCVPLKDLTKVMNRFANGGDLNWLKEMTGQEVVLARLWEG